MKYLLKYKLALFIAVVAFNACKEDIPTSFGYEPYAYAKNDETGGTWHSVVIADVSKLNIPDPPAAGSATALADLSELKSASANPSADQIKSVKFWANDGITRWNELARELISKYNLPPSPNADGTYSVPSSATPDKYPFFPFSHPTYACRALAYLSGAQYDAMIAAWSQKYKYNVPSHQSTDASIKLNLPASNLPTYPSEGAVIASVSKIMLTALFPLEKSKIEALAAEHENSLLWAGRNTRSDIKGGDSLGVLVANEFKKRLGSDGMKFAQTSKAVSDSIKDAAFKRFGWSWKNLEIPERPVGITPLFGKVKPWFIPSVEAVRPGPPPAIGSDEFNKAAEELKNIADNLTEDQRRIAYLYGDGIGTYSPPGHWNRIALEQAINAKMNPLRLARVLAYMNYAIMDAGLSCWDTKYYYHSPRPSQVIPGFKTLLGIPNFPSYTSGHSTFSGAAAAVLTHFFTSSKSEFDRIAEEAAISRLYGGIHFRFDSETELAVGKNVAAYSVGVAALDGVD